MGPTGPTTRSRHARLVDRRSGQPARREDLEQASNGLGSDSERPVFIFGLPRSGTTLTEQVLASHSRVHGSGELPLAREAFDALPATLGLDLEPAACLGRLDATAARRLAAAHLDCLSALDATADRVVDKMPDNYLYLGLLATLFPRARFIHCRRDLRDVAVSCWMTHFRQIRWANDPAHIAHRFKNYVGLMDHWRSALPVPVLEVSYEEMVADLEGQARRLLSFCGLDWEPSCLAFHETSRPTCRTEEAWRRSAGRSTTARSPAGGTTSWRWPRCSPCCLRLTELGTTPTPRPSRSSEA